MTKLEELKERLYQIDNITRDSDKCDNMDNHARVLTVSLLVGKAIKLCEELSEKTP